MAIDDPNNLTWVTNFDGTIVYIEEFSEAEKVLIRGALEAWAKFADITFTEVSDSNNKDEYGDIRFVHTSNPDKTGGLAELPGAYGSEADGDVYLGVMSGITARPKTVDGTNSNTTQCMRWACIRTTHTHHGFSDWWFHRSLQHFRLNISDRNEL